METGSKGLEVSRIRHEDLGFRGLEVPRMIGMETGFRGLEVPRIFLIPCLMCHPTNDENLSDSY